MPIVPTSFPEQFRHRALKPGTKLLQGIQRHVLGSHFEPMQGRVADARLSGKLLIREVTPLLPQKRTQLFCQPLSHLPGILVLALSHI